MARLFHAARWRAMLLVALCALLCSSSALSRALPRYPFPKNNESPSAFEQEKARELFRLTQREHEGLQWDDCLALKAFRRAVFLVNNGHFEHTDPNSGRNIAWGMVSACHRCKTAGENLSQGMEAPAKIHQALMESPTHRANILNPNFSLMGIGCYEQICVELFAGF